MRNTPARTKSLLATTWLALLAPVHAAPHTPAHIYPSGMEIAVKIGNDLYSTLDPKFQRTLDSKAISMEQLEAPVMAPIQGNRRDFLCQVSVTTGFIDLINHIAHAKAIDRIQPGYFMQYSSRLAQEGANENPVLPPNLDAPRYWADEVMVAQASLFNEMIGITMAMNLSHHYLGHCNKYAAQRPDRKGAPMNNFIAPCEWEDTVKCATLNSLDCALPTEGAKALFDFIARMSRRPAWASYIMPQGVNTKTLGNQLSKYERNYYSGGLKLGSRILALSVSSIAIGVN